MNDPALVSIVIDNFNYARFLPEAIESALAQTHPRVEVIAVDDGSTDDSREVIGRYDRQLIPVFKENGGQGSAYNAGFRACTGDVVIFLDADDVLLPHVAAEVAAAFAQWPEAAKVQYRMRYIDAQGRPQDRFEPPLHRPLPHGDLRSYVNTFRGYTTPPGSGNAYSRRALEAVLPMPEDVYSHGSDSYTGHATALVGPVLALRSVGALYREHGSNRYLRGGHLDIALMQRKLRQAGEGHPFLLAIARAQGIDSYPRHVGSFRDALLLTRRMISLKVAPKTHPFPSDTFVRVARSGVIACLTQPTRRAHQKALGAAWFLLIPILPPRLARELAERLLFPERRGAVYHLLSRLRRRVRTTDPIGGTQVSTARTDPSPLVAS